MSLTQWQSEDIGQCQVSQVDVCGGPHGPVAADHHHSGQVAQDPHYQEAGVDTGQGDQRGEIYIWFSQNWPVCVNKK